MRGTAQHWAGGGAEKVRRRSRWAGPSGASRRWWRARAGSALHWADLGSSARCSPVGQAGGSLSAGGCSCATGPAGGGAVRESVALADERSIRIRTNVLRLHGASQRRSAFAGLRKKALGARLLPSGAA